MFYPYRQDNNLKEGQAANPVTNFHHGGTMPGLHNVPGYSMQNMQNAMSSRTQGMAVPSNAGQQAPGLAGQRFAAANMQGIPQMSHAGIHGHGALGARSVVGHAFSGNINGLGGALAGNNPTGAAPGGNPRGARGGAMAVNPSHMGAAASRMATGGAVNLGVAGVGGMAAAPGGRGLGTTGGALNMASLNGSRGMGNIGMGPLAGAGGMGVQGPGRPNLNMMQQGMNMGGTSGYNQSQELLALLGSRSGQGLMNANYPTAPGSTIQSQAQTLNGQFGNLNIGTEGGGTDSSPFDMSDFPQLSQRAAAAGGALQGAAAAAALRKTANAMVGQNSEFSIQNEDFPALPGFKAVGNELGPDLQLKEPGSESTLAALQQLSAQAAGLSVAPGAQTGMGSLRTVGQFEQLVPQQPYAQQQAQALQPSTAPHMRVGGAAAVGGDAAKLKAPVAPSTPPDKYGLLGLLSVIRMTEPDLTTLALGTDLTTLGLNLNSRENLYKTFASPWADGPTRGEPEFVLPVCYMQPAPRLQPGYFAKFQQDTLFYIFYSMPGDEAQLYAADELCNRNWWFHKEHQRWFTRVPGQEPLVKTPQYERGSYYFFDPTVWETARKDNFVVQLDMLEARPQLPQVQR